MRSAVVYRETRYERVTRLIGLYVIAPLLLLAALAEAVHIAQKPYEGMAVQQVTVQNLDPVGPAARAGLAEGDRIRAVNGWPTRSMADYYLVTAGDYRLAPRSYSVARGEELFTVTLVPVAPPQSRMVWGYSLWTAGIAFLLIGWTVLSQRRDPVGRNFFAFCMIFAFLLIGIPDYPARAFIKGREFVTDVLTLLLPVFFVRFLLLFPSTARAVVENRRRLQLLLLPAIVLLLLSLPGFFPGADAAKSPLVDAVQFIAPIYMLAYFALGLVIFARKALRRDRPIQHTKLRVILIGLLGGLTPFLAAIFLGSMVPGSGLPHSEYLGFSLLLVPLTFGVAILRYGALDTAFVLRSGLIYGLSTLLVVLSYMMVVGVVGHYLTNAFGMSTYPLIIVIVAAISLAILPLRRTVQHWIDLAFYPARRANREAISQLGDELTGLIDQASVTEHLLSRLMFLYRPRRLTMLLADKPRERYVATASLGVGTEDEEPASLATDSGLAKFLDAARRPIFAEEFEDVLVNQEADQASLATLAQLDCELLVPLITGNRLNGFMAFGPKSSSALYSQEDLANLRALAVQVASIIESRRLYAESLAQRQLETELTVAKEIQAQLLPKGPLETADLTLVGRNQPCRVVGGDYYDYFGLNGDIGFCIADVAGKGIPAAMLMTTLRVTFRAEARAGISPEQVIQRLNKAVRSLLAPGQFICFFYGIYRPADGLLTFCNAGMDPPLLFRRGQHYFDQLKKGGPVLGVQDDHQYRRGTVSLGRGDLVVCYTDGITEERNAEGDFFELDRLIALVQANLPGVAAAAAAAGGDEPQPPAPGSAGIRSPMAIIGQIFKAVADFGGPDVSDDQTVMLLHTKTL